MAWQYRASSACVSLVKWHAFMLETASRQTAAACSGIPSGGSGRSYFQGSGPTTRSIAIWLADLRGMGPPSALGRADGTAHHAPESTNWRARPDRIEI